MNSEIRDLVCLICELSSDVGCAENAGHEKAGRENDGLEFDGQENEGQQRRTNAVENHLEITYLQ